MYGLTPLRGSTAVGSTTALPEAGGRRGSCRPAAERTPERGDPAGRPHGAGSAAAPPDTERLTALDACILEGIAVGTSTVELAASLYLSRKGVEYRIGLMLRQFKVPNRVALVSRAHSIGMLTVGAWPPRVPKSFVAQSD
ncbi:LuxR C-terminal-related transcriptional regulator [Streptomyces sp. NPDC057654]|uniref:LuxR C-terminal-related transcriptional regulator n=1 Tax=Streptomyces sp. NPDC057654 TaxID=3346196 RepID=UPI003692390D